MIFYFLSFGAVFLAIFAGLTFLELSARDKRRPFPTDEKLLREAGHSLRLKLAELDRSLTRQILVLILVGISPLMNLTTWSAKTGSSGWLDWLTFSVLILTIGLALVTVIRYANRRRNTTLGLFGERIVAEHLEPLKLSGHRVFHDVPAGDPPAVSAAAPFNLDHVVVGPSGVFAIETKTRRKGRTRVGFMAHEIIYDGRALAYPWGEDQYGLEQAARQSAWLAQFLQNQLGRPIPVQPLLVFPGWMIIRKGRGPVNVLNPKELPTAIERPAPSGHTGFVVPALDPATIDLVARQLEARCRDVEL